MFSCALLSCFSGGQQPRSAQICASNASYTAVNNKRQDVAGEPSALGRPSAKQQGGEQGPQIARRCQRPNVEATGVAIYELKSDFASIEPTPGGRDDSGVEETRHGTASPLEQGDFFDGPDPTTGMQTLSSALGPAEPVHVRRHVGITERAPQGATAAASGAGLADCISDAGLLGIQHAQLLSPTQLSSGPMNPRTLSTGGMQFTSHSLRDSPGMPGGGGPVAVMAAAASVARAACSTATATTSPHLHYVSHQRQLHSATEQRNAEGGSEADGSAATWAPLTSAAPQVAGAAAAGAAGADSMVAARACGDGTSCALSSSAAATALGPPSARPSTISGTTLRTLVSRAKHPQHHFYASPFATPSRQHLQTCSASLPPPHMVLPEGTAVHGPLEFERRSVATLLPTPPVGGAAASMAGGAHMVCGFASEAPKLAVAVAGAGMPASLAGDASIAASGAPCSVVIDCDSSSSTRRLRQLQLNQNPPPPPRRALQHQHSQHMQYALLQQQSAACRSPAASAIISGILPSILSRSSTQHSICATPMPPGGGGAFAMAAAPTSAMCHSRLMDSPCNLSASPGLVTYTSTHGSRLMSPAAIVPAAAAAQAGVAGAGEQLTSLRSAAAAGQPQQVNSIRTLTPAEVVFAEANAVVMSARLPDDPPSNGHRQSSSSCRSGTSDTSGVSGASDAARGRNPSFASTAANLAAPNTAAVEPPAAANTTAATPAGAAVAAPTSSAVEGAARGRSGVAAGGGAALQALPEMPPPPPFPYATQASMPMYTSAAKLLALPSLPPGLLLGASARPMNVSVTSPLMLVDTSTAAALLVSGSGAATSSFHDPAAGLFSMHVGSGLHFDHSLQLGTVGSACMSTSGDVTAAGVPALWRPPAAGKVLSTRSMRPTTASVCIVQGNQPAGTRAPVRLACSADVSGPGVQLPWRQVGPQPAQPGSEGPRELLSPSAMPRHLQLSPLQHSASSHRLCSHTESPPSQPLPMAAASNAADTILRITDLDTCWAELRDLSFLGSGACGNVYTGTWCGMPVAAKFMISGSVDQLQRQQREAALSRLASHPHMVQTYAIATAQLLPAHFRTEYGGDGGAADDAAQFSGLLSQAGDLLGTVCGTDGTDLLYGTNPLSAIISNHENPHSAAALSRCTSKQRTAGASADVLAATQAQLARLSVASAYTSGVQQQQQQQQPLPVRPVSTARPTASPFAQGAAARASSSSSTQSIATSGTSSGTGRGACVGSSSAGEACGASGTSSRRIAAMLAGAEGGAGVVPALPTLDIAEPSTARKHHGTAISVQQIAARPNLAAVGGSVDSGVEMFSASFLADATSALASTASEAVVARFRGFELGAAGNSPTIRQREQQQHPRQQQRLRGAAVGAQNLRSQHQHPAAGEAAGSSPAAAAVAVAGACAFSGSSRSTSSHGSQPLRSALGAQQSSVAGAINTTGPRPRPCGSATVRSSGLSAVPGLEESPGSMSIAKAIAGSSSHLGGGGAPQRRSMQQISTGDVGASQSQPQAQGAAADREDMDSIAISTVDTDMLEAAAQRPRAILPGNVGSRGRGGDSTAAGVCAPDSFELGARVSFEALAMLQPADVLAHIGARPGQWLTVVIMEEMDRGSLHRAIHGGIFDSTASHLSKRHRVRGMVRTLVEVAQGMAALHASGLVHGDLKPANVLLKAQTRDARGFVAKVSDFGSTRVMLEGMSAATVTTNDWGTVIYTAPEVFNGRSGPPADVYSFGALTWHLTTGQLPHEDLNPFAVLLAVSKGELELEWPSSVPKPLRRLGQLCMQHDPAARPTFAVIARALLKLEQRIKAQSTGAAGKRSEAGRRS